MNCRPDDEEGSNVNIMVDNNLFDGCGVASFWQPSCVWMGGYDNFTVRNNEMTNNPFALIRIRKGADTYDIREGFPNHPTTKVV